MKKFAMLPLVLLLLTSCNGGNSSMSNSQNSNSLDNSIIAEADENLKTFPYEIRDTYDNVFKDDKMPGAEVVWGADPFVYRFDGMYYLYVTTGGPNLNVWKSEDLLKWENVGNVLQVGAPNQQSPWAPEVTYINGKFYLISSFAGVAHTIFTSDSPVGPFTPLSNTPIDNAQIDGSFFIDKDEKVYCTIASSSGIKVFQMKDDMSGFKESKYGQYYLYNNTELGVWNEGPYITLRDGHYYLTWTGVGCYQPSYRVHYNYLDSGSVFAINAFEQRCENVLLDTSMEWNGLGHSANFLGPDLDSYYIGYHSSERKYESTGFISTSKPRFFNYSRLSFNGSTMVADHAKKENNFVPRMPEFSTRGTKGFETVGDFLLSNTASNDTFSVEYNVKGGNQTMVFAYQDENNYGYANFENNSVVIRKKVNGNAQDVLTVPLNRQYDFSKLHTLRLGYKDGELAVYFDTVEKVCDYKCEFNGGKVGYLNNNLGEIGYTAYSNVAHGSSDQEEYTREVTLANQYQENASILREGSGLVEIEKDENVVNPTQFAHTYNLHLENKNDRGTFLTYFDEEQEVFVDLRVPSSMSGKKVGIKVNNEAVEEFTVENLSSDNQEYVVQLGKVKVNAGRNYISIVAIDSPIDFSRIHYQKAVHTEEFKMKATLKAMNGNLTWYEYGAKTMKYTNDGLYSNGKDSNFARVKNGEDLYNTTIEATVVIKQTVSQRINDPSVPSDNLTKPSNDRFAAGIVLGVNNYEYFRSNESGYASSDINSLEGMYLGINSEKIFLRDCNYSDSENVFEMKKKFALDKEYTLKMVQEGKKITAYLDGEKLCEYYSSNLSPRGNAGCYSYYLESLYTNLTIESNK